ncbi:MAG: hypothetical protein ACI9LM_003454 [Alteromonadaceae bacterium]|jgi:hypothetical protein
MKNTLTANFNQTIAWSFLLHLHWLIKLLFTTLCLLPMMSKADFDPELLSQSTVRILIKNKQGVIGAASGFIWQQPDQIVTSLHVMANDKNAKIIIEFGKKRRLAKVKAVLPYADLVLLTVSKPIKEWLPLLSFDPIKPKYKARVSALGFNRGSLGMSTRELIKGYAKPEVLQQFLPESAVSALSKSKMPDIQLPIYYLDGSLLPGYSGAPIVNAEGKLIGIGNGGLENGAANVSWVIPAQHLVALQNSSKHHLPVNLDQTSKIFTLDKVDQRTKTIVQHWQQPLDKSLMHELSWLQRLSQSLIRRAYAEPALSIVASGDSTFSSSDVNYKVVKYQQFTFVNVKTRSYQQMLLSSGTPANMEQVFTLFNMVFKGYQVDYQSFLYDVYEDDKTGLNILVPYGVDLMVDDGYLLAQGEMFCRTCDYEIQYHARVLNDKTALLIKESPYEFLHDIANQHWQDLNDEGDFQEYSDFRTIENFGADRYILRATFSDFAEPFKQEFELNYFTAATNKKAWFQAQGILNRFDDDFWQQVNANRGTNCQLPQESLAKVTLCEDISTVLKVLISVHLTAFSNQFFLPSK